MLSVGDFWVVERYAVRDPWMLLVMLRFFEVLLKLSSLIASVTEHFAILPMAAASEPVCTENHRRIYLNTFPLYLGDQKPTTSSQSTI